MLVKNEKVKLKKKTPWDFDQGTLIIQTASFTTSNVFGYLDLSRVSLPKTSIKISATLLQSQIGYPLYPSRQVCWAQSVCTCKRLGTTRVQRCVCCRTTAQEIWSRPTATILWTNLSFDWTSTLSLFLEIFANHVLVYLSSERPVHLQIGRMTRSLEMEDKSVLQLLFWNRFHAIKVH